METMKNRERTIYGLVITFVIFIISTQGATLLPLGVDFIPSTFMTHSLMLLLSLSAIFLFKKSVAFKLSFPKFKKSLRPFLFGLIASILVNVSITLIIKLFGAEAEVHPLLAKMTPFQIFVFVFIYASISEELLFRGFLQNILKPLNTKGIYIFKRRISLPVIISAVAFGLGHLVLITSGVGVLFLVRVVIFTTSLGLVAGYYQEKNDNTAYGIIVHMAGNFPPLVGAFVMSLYL